ncbi:MAG: hypothetical protein QUS12_06710, partial [Methanosarcina sp.]|nr:hypothetical protein [Methanosarcina sp.]
ETRDDEPSEEEEKAPEEEKPQEPVKKPGKKKWVFIILIGVILGGSAIGYRFRPERFQNLFKKEFKGPEIINEDDLSEENISPFFVPPGEADQKTIRIDLTIVWDGIASIKYKKNELSARQMMSERFYKLAKQHPDLNTVKSDLENEIGSILRSSLGVQSLNIRIKEIRYF